MIYCISNGTIRHGVQYLFYEIYMRPPIFVFDLLYLFLLTGWMDSSMITLDKNQDDWKRFGGNDKR